MYPVTIYTVGDTVWFVDAERPLLEEVISALPDPPRAEAAYDLAAISPVELGGRRRAALYVQSGWETPFRTLRFHIDNDQLVEDAFLATGARLDDLTAAYVEWLPGESERVAFLIAFQIAGADATVMRQVFEEVLLPHMGRGPFRQEAGQIASRDVILLWDDEASEGETTPPLYLYVSGDTIWFVDAEQPMSAAIVAALPPSAPRAIPGYDLAADLPDEFGGVTRTELLVESGWTVPLASMTLMELDQVATEVIALTGAGADDLATASGMSMEAGFDTTIAAYQVRGADPEAMREVLEEVLIPRLGGGQTRHELVDVDGREVFRLHTGLGSGEPSYLFVNGDTIWWLHAGESFLTDLFAELP